MSIRAVADRSILSNITNMNDRGGDTREESTPSGGVVVNENTNMREKTRGVKADNPTPPATTASPMLLNSTTIVARSTGDGVNCTRRLGNAASRKDCLRSIRGCSSKFLPSNSGSGGSQRKEDCSEECSAKKRKTRRGKPKRRKLKPFAKQSMSYDERSRCRAIGRLTKAQPPAPYNTTQFLMEDHSDLPDLDRKLADAITEVPPASFQKPPPVPPRTRDSSFSVDSEEDYFYSSPENEEEFLTKEFSSAYEDLHAERLSALTKSELIQEYVQFEAKFDMLTKRLRCKNAQQTNEEKDETRNGGGATCDSTVNDLAKKLKACQQRLDDLMQQNEKLRRENETLRAKNRSPISSVDSESDSVDTSSTRSSCSCSAGSPAGSPNPPAKCASYKSRKGTRRKKKESSVDTESDDDGRLSTSSSKNGLEKDESDLVNGNSSYEVGGLAT